MRIVIATGIFPPDIGGPATYARIVAEEFSRRGHIVAVVTFSDASFAVSLLQTETGSVFKTYYISRTMPKGIRHIAYFWNVLKAAVHADVIYAQDAVSAGVPAALAALLLNKYFYLKIVGDHAWEQALQRFGVTELLDEFLTKTYGLRVSFLRMAERVAAWQAERIIVPSAYLKTVVERWGISAGKITVIPNAVSVSSHSISKEEARKQLAMCGFIIVTAGRLVPWKGFIMLVDIMPKILTVMPDAKLYIIGSGPEEERIAGHIARHNLQNSVHTLGSLPKDTLTVYMTAADVFCLNTGYEGFSHQLIEALALGVPVITTDAGGNRELIRNGENALVAGYNNQELWYDAIVRLAADKDLYARLARPKKEIITRYTVDAMVSKTESVLSNI
jgi:glycosyltransferase involved in cell wall biosynthesis